MLIRENRFKIIRAIALSVAAVMMSACLRIESSSPIKSSIDSDQARQLGDSIASDLVAGDTGDLHQKLEKRFRDSVDDQQLKSIVQQMVQVYGRPIDFELKQDELGSKIYPDGSTKAMCKLWYAAKTTMYEKGSNFLIVEVVPDGRELAVSSFAIVNFPLGVPETLK